MLGSAAFEFSVFFNLQRSHSTDHASIPCAAALHKSLLKHEIVDSSHMIAERLLLQSSCTIPGFYEFHWRRIKDHEDACNNITNFLDEIQNRAAVDAATKKSEIEDSSGT